MKKRKSVEPIVSYFIKPYIDYPEQDVLINNTSESIEIGYVVKSHTLVKASIPLNNLFEHVFVTGSTGSGKTYTVSRIVNELIARKHSVTTIIFDWHGEYRNLLREYDYIEPFKNSINIFSDIDSLVDLLVDTLDLTHPQAYLLEKIVKQSNREISDIDTLINIVENYVDESSWMRESRLSLLRKLSLLNRSRYVELFNSGNNGCLDRIINRDGGVYVIDLYQINNTLVRRIYMVFLLKKILNLALSNLGRVKSLIVIEEAQNIVDREKPVKLLLSMLAEVRKFGVGLIIVSQSPFKLMEDVMINTNTKIVHSLKSSIDLDIINKVLYLPEEYRRILPYLDVGEAILYTRGFKKPVLIKVDTN
uniref:ATP-binding protein n=1 Tax=Staphylothermus marinus TaxID=2280 RepID=A0A7C4HE43_STAMA